MARDAAGEFFAIRKTISRTENIRSLRKQVSSDRPAPPPGVGVIALSSRTVSLNAPQSLNPEELGFAARLVQGWPTEMRCLPGNHDMGDGSGEAPLDDALLASYTRQFGPDHWHLAADGWSLLGINAQLLGSGTPQELEQWRWIEEMATASASPARSVLFLHRPLARVRPDDTKDKGRYVARAARERLIDGPLKSTLRLVVSGHTHQYLDIVASNVRHVWMPSSGFVLPDQMQGRIGEKLVGIGLLELHGDAMRFDLWCPDGMARHDLSAMPAFRAMAAKDPTINPPDR
jgi:hypothetical protein